MSDRRTPSRSKPCSWIAYRIHGAKAEVLGHVDASDMDAAIAAAAAEFGVDPKRVLVQQLAR
ncbi:MAG TPA: hypothetical protein VFY92_05445 [Hyphomicrobiaceae bacterium]|nr:hypothetical protein [Hyphomicrobiaceae bacterium]